MFTKLKSNIREMLVGPDNKLQVSKVMLFFGWLFISAYMWELIWKHEFRQDYLIIYIAFISGQHLTSKWLDKKPDGGNSGKDAANAAQ